MSSEIIDKLIECGVLALDHDCPQSEICESTTDLADNILEEYDADPYSNHFTTYRLEKAKLPSCISWEINGDEILIWETYDKAEEFAVQELANSMEGDPEGYGVGELAIGNGFTYYTEKEVLEQYIDREVEYWQEESESAVRQELVYQWDEYEKLTDQWKQATVDYNVSKSRFHHYPPILESSTMSLDLQNYMIKNDIDCDISWSFPYLYLSSNSEDRLLEVRHIVDIYGTMKILSNYTQDSVGEFDDQFQTLLSSKDRENVVLGHDLMTRLEEYDSHNLFEIVGQYTLTTTESLTWKEIYEECQIFEDVAYIISLLGQPLTVQDLSSTLAPEMKATIDFDVVDMDGEFDLKLMRLIILGLYSLANKRFIVTNSYDTYELGIQILRHLGDYNLWIKNHKKFGSRLKDALEITCAVLNHFHEEAEIFTVSLDDLKKAESEMADAEYNVVHFDIYDYDMWYQIVWNVYKDYDMYEYLTIDHGLSVDVVLEDYFGGVDYNGLADWIVRMDGIGHAIHSYDGTLHECDDLYYVVR